MENELVEQVKAFAEEGLEKLVETGKLDLLVEAIAKKVCELIPTSIDDALIAGALPEVKKFANKEALKLIEQISDKV